MADPAPKRIHYRQLANRLDAWMRARLWAQVLAGLVLGVDRFLDMARTSVNVTGDLAAARILTAKTAANSARKPHATPDALSSTQGPV